MARLEATVTRLIGLYAQDNQQYAYADFIGDNDDIVNEANQGRGRGFPNRGRGIHPVGVPRPRHRAPQEDGVFGRPKFTIPKFRGKDVEEYLNLEMCIEAMWRLYECTDDRKICLAVSKFDEYAMSWWGNAVNIRRDNNMIPMLTWHDMKAEMRHRFVPPNYTWSLYDKLTNLKQGLKPIDEYYQEMELIMQRAKVHEPVEQTMQHFVSGLTYQIRRIVRHHPYNDMAQLLHQVREAEASVAEEAKSSHPTATRSRFSSWTSSAGQPTVGPRDSSSVGGFKAPTSAKSGTPDAKSVPQPAMSGSGSTTSTARNRDMLNKETNEYETGDDSDPFDEEDDD
jgi:hypothetical protein